jgi:hypothetical protein
MPQEFQLRNFKVVETSESSEASSLKIPTITLKTIRRIGYVFASIAAAGALIVEAEADVGRWDAISIYASIIMIIGAVPFVVIQTWLRHKTPKTEREVRDRLRVGGAPVTLGFGGWVMGFLMGVAFESLIFQLQYGALYLLIFCIMALLAFFETRRAFGTEANLTLLLSVASSLAVPFSILGLRNPELLATAFPIQFDALLSRRISLLLFAANQVFLGAAMVLMAGNLWRNKLLTTNKITEFDFQRLNDQVADVIARTPVLAGIEGPLRDISSVVDLFQRAESKAVFGWGWSVIDRILTGFHLSRYDAAMALGLGDRYTRLKDVRNKTVHEGYAPTLTNAKDMLLLVRETVLAITKIDEIWLAGLKSRPKKEIEG